MSSNLPWIAEWIGYAAHPEAELGFFEFENDFQIECIPKALLIRISADQRYTLLVNGRVVGRGPQRGDVLHWHFESIDIAPYLQTGRNTIRAEVTNFGRLAPMAQHSARLGFLLDASPPYEFLSTPGQWKVRRRADRSFAMMHDGVGEYYIDVGPGEVLDRTQLEGTFQVPHRICRAESRGQPGGGSPWSLIQATIPPFADSDPINPRAAYIRKSEVIRTIPIDFCEVPAGWELILDFGELTCGYPHVWFTADRDTHLRVTYCESLWDGDSKGYRSEIGLKTARGYEDRVVVGEEGFASFSSSWWRTFRYISVRAEPETPFALGQGFQIAPIGHRFEVNAAFEGDDPCIEPIWNLCLRTLRLCASETYFDCPYYEQLQYVGDTRLQALIGYYLSSERYRQRNAIDEFHWSLMENGLTQSRYPSRQPQVIPPFSLWWVVMLYDAWMHDPGFSPDSYLRTAHGVITAYRELLMRDPSESFWNFGDWLPEWKWGVPPDGARAEMHLILLAMADWCLAKIEGRTAKLTRPNSDPERHRTEHAESLWRYWQLIAGLQPDPWPDPGEPLIAGTYFWQFYKHEAQASHDYLAELDEWRSMLSRGLTTTPETPEPTRSDCHGWSAHPALGFFLQIAGIRSAGPGWSKCEISPKPGSLKRFSAAIPHPAGALCVRLENGTFTVESPVPFDWSHRSSKINLEPGKYEFASENLEPR